MSNGTVKGWFLMKLWCSIRWRSEMLKFGKGQISTMNGERSSIVSNRSNCSDDGLIPKMSASLSLQSEN